MTVMEPVIAWLMGCGLKRVTLAVVMAGADRPRKPVLRVLDRLVREGYLAEVEDNKIHCKRGECGPDKRNPTWRILDKTLSIPKNQAKRQTYRDKMWKIIRVRNRFTIVELQRLSGASYDTVLQYVGMLARDKYVRKIGKDGRRTVWMLIRGHKIVARPRTKEGRK